MSLPSTVGVLEMAGTLDRVRVLSTFTAMTGRDRTFSLSLARAASNAPLDLDVRARIVNGAQVSLLTRLTATPESMTAIVNLADGQTGLLETFGDAPNDTTDDATADATDDAPTELLLFVTPHIVKADVDLARIAAAEATEKTTYRDRMAAFRTATLHPARVDYTALPGLIDEVDRVAGDL
jgi:hypothetical protein